MKYVVHFTGCVYIEAENAAQAAKQAKKYRVIGAAVGSERSMKQREPIRFERGTADLRMGLPMRVTVGGGK